MARIHLQVERFDERIVPANLPTGFEESVLAAGLSLPTSVAVAPDGRLFITEKGGAIKIVKNGQLLATPFAQLTVETDFERGLQSLTFDPEFELNGKVYVYYTLPEASGVVRNTVAVLNASGDKAVGDPVPIITLDPTTGPAHNGGSLAFGPDGKLYVSTGDASNQANSQLITNRLGKILRYNSDGTIPTDNPTSFPLVSGTTTGENRAIWAIGLRNPFTMSFQPGTGRLFINDVGGSKFEEVNVGQAGANYGWPVAEGYPGPEGAIAGLTYPIYSYPNLGRAAIAGSAFYNPAAVSFPSEYVGDYFFADYVNGFIYVRDAVNGSVTTFATGANGLVNLSVLPDGRLAYLVITDSQGNEDSGKLYAINFGTGEIPPGIAQPPLDLLVSDDETAVFAPAYSGSSPLTFQWQRDSGTGFENIPGARSPSFSLFNATLSDSGSLFRVIVTNPFGTVTSEAAELTVTDSERPTVSIVAPDPSFLFEGGKPVSFAFTATDPETGVLPPEAFRYRVDYITGSASPRPFIPVTTGQSGNFTAASVTPYLRPDVAYRITVTVTDDVGLTATTTRDVFPRITSFTLNATFDNIDLTLDGATVPAGHVEQSVVGLERQISAAEQFRSGTKLYRFIGWSDDPTAPAVRTIIVPSTPLTFLAQYELVSVSSGSEAFGVVVAAAGRAARIEAGQEVLVVEPFGEAFTGEIRLARGDLTGDGVPDIVAAAGPGGGPHIKIFDGVNGEEVTSFFAYDASFTGGVFIATGDVDGDGAVDLILAAGPGGGPHVKVLRYSDLSEIISFFAFDESFTGGVRVAAGDVDGDGRFDLITSAGSMGGPHVKVFDGLSFEEILSFFAYDASFTGGVWIASADINQDGFWELLTGTGPGAAPHVKAFTQLEELSSFYAFDETFAGGVRVGSGDDNFDGFPDIVVGAGPGGAPHVRVFDGQTGDELVSLLFGEPDATGGVFVG